MNVLIMNYRYFVSGGPERYMFNIKERFEADGHRVIPFSFGYAQSEETEYARYFAELPGGAEGAFYKDLKQSPMQKLAMFAKVVYNRDAKDKLKTLLRDHPVDVAYALQVVNTLYPSVVDACAEMNVPVVYRLSDFQFLCPAYKFFREGRICEECIHGAYYHGFVHRCLKGSFAVSGARVFSMYVDRFRSTRSKVAAFVTPSAILRDKMIEGGFPAEKLHHIPTFVESQTKEPRFEPGDYILYAGAIDPYKGVRELVAAYAMLPESRRPKLLIAGYSLGDEEDFLKNLVEKEGIAGVEFPGFKSGVELAELYQNALCSMMPTLWYENMPNAVLEAMAYGKPVLASNHGGVAEMIDHEENGLLFAPGDVENMRDAMLRLVDEPELARRLGENARRKVETEYSPDRHYTRLMDLFESVRNQSGHFKQ